MFHWLAHLFEKILRKSVKMLLKPFYKIFWETPNCHLNIKCMIAALFGDRLFENKNLLRKWVPDVAVLIKHFLARVTLYYKGWPYEDILFIDFWFEQPFSRPWLLDDNSCGGGGGDVYSSVPEFIEPVFTKTSPKRSFSVIQNERFGLVFAKTGSTISGSEKYRTYL